MPRTGRTLKLLFPPSSLLLQTSRLVVCTGSRWSQSKQLQRRSLESSPASHLPTSKLRDRLSLVRLDRISSRDVHTDYYILAATQRCLYALTHWAFAALCFNPPVLCMHCTIICPGQSKIDRCVCAETRISISRRWTLPELPELPAMSRRLR